MTIPESVLFQIIGSTILAALWWFFRDKIKSMQRELDAISNEVHEVRYNYLDRFAKLHAEVQKGTTAITGMIADLREDLAKHYVPKTYCERFQELHNSRMSHNPEKE